MKLGAAAILGLLLLCMAAAFGQSWFYAWDGTSEFSCTPTAEGNVPFWLRPTDVPSFSGNCYWEITDNGSTGKALRVVDQSTTLMLRWQGAGSRPEHYRGPCQSFAHDNLRSVALLLVFPKLEQGFLANNR